jgi:hypothetical protein
MKNVDTGTNYYANTINNNDPGPGQWNASNFPDDRPSGVYLVFVEGDDESVSII